MSDAEDIGAWIADKAVDARTTLILKKSEAEKGHDWVVDNMTISCEQFLAVAAEIDRRTTAFEESVQDAREWKARARAAEAALADERRAREEAEDRAQQLSDIDQQASRYWSEARAAEARLARAVEGLRPFAELCQEIDERYGDYPDLCHLFWSMTHGDLRRARAILKDIGGEPGGEPGGDDSAPSWWGQTTSKA